METNHVINEYQQAIVAIYRERNLSCLSGLDRSFRLNGRNILEWYFKVIQKAAQRNKQFQYNKNLDDIIFCSDELLFFTANLYLYRPHINNPLKDAYPAGDGKIYPNFQNLAGKRYNMFADIASQAAYNYWDRIGDLIASFFPDRIAPDRVFLTTAVDIVPDELRHGEYYPWLKHFKECEYAGLNKKRRQAVHYTTLDTEFSHEHVKIAHEKEAIEALQAEREELTDFYREHIYLTFAGYEKTLLFLEEVSPILFPETI